MKRGDELTVDIEDLAFGGKGIAKVEGFVVFVELAVPGQRVRIRIKDRKKDYAEAQIVEILKHSPYEQKLDYQRVPGAPWAQISLQKQIEYKRKQVFELFVKFARVDLTLVFDEMIPSPTPWFYRNKMEYSFGPTDEECIVLESSDDPTIPEKKEWTHTGFGLGSKQRGQYWLVENLEQPSGIFDKSFEEKLSNIRTWCESTHLPVYNTRTNEGFFRLLMVRKSFETDQLLVNLITTSKGEAQFPAEKFVSFLQERFGDRLAGVVWTRKDGVSDGGMGYNERSILYGEDRLIERMNGLEFQMSVDSFFQTNILSAEKLYEKVFRYADLQPRQRAIDLFCGTGTIAQILAHYAPESSVTGVELIESAVRDAEANAERNSLKNVKFYAMDVKEYLRKYKSDVENTDVIILDPPRAGVGEKALMKVMGFAPKKIVYVSCNPATMARDTVILKKEGYKLTRLSMVDQFPHTPHVECVGEFQKEFSN